MKKMLASLAPFKKVRPSRKTLLVGGYLLVVSVLLVAVTWRGFAPEPVDLDPGEQAEWDAPLEEESVLTRPEAPFNALDEEEVIEGILPENAVPVLTVPSEPMQWPLEGEMLAGHHEVYRIGNTLRAHVGVDLKAEHGAEVKAAWPGIVEHVTEDPRLGWLLEIRHGGNYLTQYANLLEEPYVAVGDEVKMGDVIGTLGESAKLDASEGTFLHFAVYQEGKALDPVELISPR